jgi:hypothetical protein
VSGCGVSRTRLRRQNSTSQVAGKRRVCRVCRVHSFQFVVVRAGPKGLGCPPVFPWDREGRTIWIADAHGSDRKRFVVHVDC